VPQIVQPRLVNLAPDLRNEIDVVCFNQDNDAQVFGPPWAIIETIER
jgi:hypothetical protein